MEPIPNNQIRYTSKNNVIVEPNSYANISAFGANIVSNENGIITFDGDVKKIPEEVFKNSSLVSVILPNSVIEIDRWAFQNSSYLTSVELPSQLKYIKKYAFSGTSITQIDLPSSVESIGIAAFPNNKIETIICHSNNAPKLDYGYTESKDNETRYGHNYLTLGKAKVYAPNPSTFGNTYSGKEGDWRFYMVGGTSRKDREILDIYDDL